MLKLYTHKVIVTLPKEIKCIATDNKRAFNYIREIILRHVTVKLERIEDITDTKAYLKALKEITT